MDKEMAHLGTDALFFMIITYDNEKTRNSTCHILHLQAKQHALLKFATKKPVVRLRAFALNHQFIFVENLIYYRFKQFGIID